jgi:hypothetical protein
VTNSVLQSSSAMNRDQVRSYLTWLAHPIFQLAAIPPGEHGSIRIANVETQNEAISFLRSNCKFNLYCSVNHPPDFFLGTQRRAKAGDITEPRVLLLDVDPKSHDLPAGRALLCALAMLSPVVGVDPNALLVDSGRGAQILVHCLDGNIRGTWEKIRAQAKKVLQLYACKLDPTYDAVRLARIAGTVNHRTGRMAQV